MLFSYPALDLKPPDYNHAVIQTFLCFLCCSGRLWLHLIAYAGYRAGYNVGYQHHCWHVTVKAVCVAKPSTQHTSRTVISSCFMLVYRFSGVSQHGRRFCARVCYKNARPRLGTFATETEAAEAHDKACIYLVRSMLPPVVFRSSPPTTLGCASTASGCHGQ